MSCLRNVSLALVLALLPGLAMAATTSTGATGEGSNPRVPGCQVSILDLDLNQNQSLMTPGPVAKSSFCEQYYCPGTAPLVQCNCACDAEECLCAESCGPGNFHCYQACRNQLNNCYVACQEL